MPKEQRKYEVRYQNWTLCKASDKQAASDIAAALNAKYSTLDYYVVELIITEQEVL